MRNITFIYNDREICGGFALSSVDMRTDVADKNADYPQISNDLHDLLNRSGECVGIRNGFLSLDIRFEFLEESLHQDEIEENQYFYHSDHLGSSAWISDGGGYAYEHIEYLPYGELFIQQKAGDWDTRYKFTGKERDSETGFDYFGARYYSSGLSIWLSVDPLSIKYPSTSPYMYVGGHPTMVIDPDGRDWIQDKNGNYKYHEGITKDTKLQKGEKYLGKSSKIDVNDSEGNYSHSYNLNEDGSFSDTRGNHYEAGSGEFDPEFKSGHKIISENGALLTGFVQYEARAAMFATGSIAYGVAVDISGTAMLYRTWSAGGGLALGYTANPTFGGVVGGGSGAMAGSGVNIGLFTNIIGVQGSGEINLYCGGKYGLRAAGACGSGSTMPFSTGYGLGAYVDYSNTTILARGTLPEMLKMYYQMVDQLNRMSQNYYNQGRELNSHEGVYMAPWNDLGSK